RRSAATHPDAAIAVARPAHHAGGPAGHSLVRPHADGDGAMTAMLQALDSAAAIDAGSATRDDALLSLLTHLRDHDYRFVTVTPASHQRLNRRPENARARDLRGVFGW